MTIEEAIKRPFQNLQKLAIGTIISAIPLVNIIAVGYFLECFRRSMKKDNSLPEWEDWSKIILDGLKAAVVGIAYAIPLMILMLIIMIIFMAIFGGPLLTAVGAIASGNQAIANVADTSTKNVVDTIANVADATTKIQQAFFANIGALFFVFLIFIAAAIIISLLSTAAVVHFAETEKFDAAFAFKEVKSVGLTLRFLISVLVAGIVASFVGLVIAIPVIALTFVPLVGAIINFLGSGLVSFAAGVIFWTILGERYARNFQPARTVFTKPVEKKKRK